MVHNTPIKLDESELSTHTSLELSLIQSSETNTGSIISTNKRTSSGSTNALDPGKLIWTAVTCGYLQAESGFERSWDGLQLIWQEPSAKLADQKISEGIGPIECVHCVFDMKQLVPLLLSSTSA